MQLYSQYRNASGFTASRFPPDAVKIYTEDIQRSDAKTTTISIDPKRMTSLRTQLAQAIEICIGLQLAPDATPFSQSKVRVGII